MTNYYEEITGINAGMSVEQINIELVKQERMWHQREINNPEKATKMLALIIDAKEVFKTESAKAAYDRDLANSYKITDEADGKTANKELYQQWKKKADDFASRGELDLAKTAYEKALMYEEPDSYDYDFLDTGIRLYRALGDNGDRECYETALRIVNKGILLSDDPAIFYSFKETIYENKLRYRVGDPSENFNEAVKAYREEEKLLLNLNDNWRLGCMYYSGMAYFYKNYGSIEDLKLARMYCEKAREYFQKVTGQHYEYAQNYLNKENETLAFLKEIDELEQAERERIAAQEREEEEYRAELKKIDEETQAYKRKLEQNKKASALSWVVLIVAAALAVLLAGVRVPISTVLMMAGVGFFCIAKGNANKSVRIGIMIAIAIVYAIVRSTRLYAILGYGASNAHTVQIYFVINALLVIATAVGCTLFTKFRNKN